MLACLMLACLLLPFVAGGLLLAGEGSNLQPPDPKSGVLPIELPAKGCQRKAPATGRRVTSSTSLTHAEHRRGPLVSTAAAL